MMMIQHSPVFYPDQITAYHQESDGATVVYVCTTELKEPGDNIPVDIFYRDTPHPEFGNRYFGLYFHPWTGVPMIVNADEVEGVLINAVEDPDGKRYYSRFRHDCVKTPGGLTIDGGRAYTRRNTSEMITYAIKDGKMMECA